MSDLVSSKVYDSLAVLEQFEALVANLSSYCQTLPEKHKPELEHHLSSLKTLIELIDIDGSTNASTEKLSGQVPRSIIERYGIGGELIRLRREGRTLNQLQLQFNVSASTIRRFFRLYDEASPKKRLEMQRTSIFDSAKQMEDLSITIQRSIARLEGQNDEVNVKFVSELRQLIELAMKFAEKMANYEKFERLQTTVVEILSKELPGRRVEILRKLQSAYRNDPVDVIEAEVNQVEHSRS